MAHCLLNRCVTLVFLILSSGSLAAQDAITIKLKTRADGESMLITKKDVFSSKIKIVDGQGKTLFENTERAGIDTEYRETVVKREGKKPATKLERAYTKFKVVKDNDTKTLPVENKTVVIEKKGDKYSFAVKDGEELTGLALDTLMKEFGRKKDTDADLEELVLPKKAVKPGEKWDVEMAKIVETLNKDGVMDMDAAKAAGTGALTKAYKKDGKQFGVMEFKMAIPVKSIGKGKGIMQFGDGVTMQLTVTLDACIDGTSEVGVMRTAMQMNGDATLPNAPGATVSVSTTGEMIATQRDVEKK